MYRVYRLAVVVTLCLYVASVAGQPTPTRTRGGGNRFPTPRIPRATRPPTRPATRSPTRPPTEAPSSPVKPAPVKSSIRINDRESASRTKSAQRTASATRSSSGLRSGLRASAAPVDGSAQSLPKIFSTSKAENDRLGRTRFSQGSKKVHSNQVSATQGKVSQSGSSLLIYFGDDFVILFGTFYPIINGQIHVFGSYYVVCSFTLASADLYICCHDQIYEKGFDDIQCCGSNYYLPATEICCNGKYKSQIDEKTGLQAQCCGDIYYLPQIEICCGDLPYLKSEAGCCAGVVFAKDKYCCHNTYLYYASSSVCRKCVSTHLYKCCRGKRYRRKSSKICCGRNYINRSSKSCCAGKPFNFFRYKCCRNGTIKRLHRRCR